MPREQIVYPIAHVFDENEMEIDQGVVGKTLETPRGGRRYAESGLSVNWGSAVPDDHFHVGLDIDIERLRQIVKEYDRGERSDGLAFVSVDVHRQEANQLIRVVRRARNAVFGVDE